MERQNIRYFGLTCHLEYVMVQDSKNVPLNGGNCLEFAWEICAQEQQI